MTQLIPNQDGRIIIKVGGVTQQLLTTTTIIFLAVNSSPELWSLMWYAVPYSSYGYMHNIAPPNITITQIPTATPSKIWVLQRGPLYS